MRVLRTLVQYSAISLLLILACREAPTAPQSAHSRLTLLSLSGDAQQGIVGSALADPVRVTVLNDAGQPAGGVQVAWSTAAGSGSVALSSSVSGSDGTATAAWTLGTQAGRQTLTATLDQAAPVTFVATALPGAPVSLRVSPETLDVEVDSAANLRASAADQYGNAVSTSSIVWRSLDPEVAAVDSVAGTIVGLGVGYAQVKAAVPTGSTTAVIRVGRFDHGIAIRVSSDSSLLGLAFGQDGSVLAAIDDPSGGSVPGAVYTTKDSSSAITVFPDSAGLPKSMKFGKTLIQFANWTTTKVDIAVIDSTGFATVSRGVQLSSAAAHRIAVLRTIESRPVRARVKTRRRVGQAAPRFPHRLGSPVTVDQILSVLRGMAEGDALIGAASCTAKAVVGTAATGVIATECQGLLVDALIDKFGLDSDVADILAASAEFDLDASECAFLGIQSQCDEAAKDFVLALAANTVGVIDDVQDITALLDQRTTLTYASAAPGSPADGNGQHGLTGQALPLPLGVFVYRPTLLTSTPEPVAGVVVHFIVASGGGTITASATTDATGQAVAYWTLGAQAGGQAAQAIVPGINGSPVLFGASATSSVAAPPLVAIALPTSSQSFTQGATVKFVGSAQAAGGQPISGSELTWSSDIDGVLGHGSTLSIATLSAGTHKISLTATDVAGVSGSASTRVQIVSSCSPLVSLQSTTYSAGPNVAPGAAFTVTWLLKNSSSCALLKGAVLRYVSGAMSINHADMALQQDVAPGASYAFSLAMHAPVTPGSYRDVWQLLTDAGAIVSVNGGSSVSAAVAVGPNSADITSPNVVQVSPTTPLVSTVSQPIAVFGTGFEAGCSVTVVDPGGATTTVTAASLQTLSPSSFALSLVLNKAGAWTLKVTNPNGKSSNSFAFVVGTAAVTLADLVPQSITVSPNPAMAGAAVTVAYVVANTGGSAAPASHTKVQIKSAANALLTEQTFSTSQIAANGSVSETRSLSLAGASPGTYNAFVIVDNTQSEVAQSNYVNDYSAGIPFTVQAVTSGGPTVATTSATSVTQNGFQMNGSINPNGVATEGYFEYATNAAFSPVNVTDPPINVGAGTANVSIQAPLSAGACGTTYYYRSVGVNANKATVRGSPISQTTLACSTAAYALTVNATGTGTGTVTSAPSGINCWVSSGASGGTCVANFPSGTPVMLSANATSGSTFAGWAGDECSGVGSCQFVMNQGRGVAATFTGPAQPFALSVSGGGSGTGTITSDPAGINCTVVAGVGSGECTASFNNGTAVTLTSTAAAGHTFNGWGGAAAGCASNKACTLHVTGALAVSANFGAPDYSVTTSANPSAGGTTVVIGGTGSSGTFVGNSTVTATATANAGYTFRNWELNGVQESVNSTYQFTLTGNVALVANFTANSTAPAAPTGLTATPFNSTIVKLQWSGTNDLTQTEFLVERATASGGPWAATSAGLQSSSSRLLLDTPPSPGTWYYRVRECTNATGCSEPSNVASVSLP